MSFVLENKSCLSWATQMCLGLLYFVLLSSRVLSGVNPTIQNGGQQGGHQMETVTNNHPRNVQGMKAGLVPNGKTLSSESVSLSVLSSTRKSGQFQDMLTIPSDSCSRTWANILPWQSMTITCPSAVPNSTCRESMINKRWSI